MSDPQQPGVSAPWYRSPVQIAQFASLVSALALLFPKAALYFGLVDPAHIQAFAEWVAGATGLVISGVTAVANLYGMRKRARATIAPLTLTQARADAKNASPTTSTTGDPTP
jgi:hypothetical protein